MSSSAVDMEEHQLPSHRGVRGGLSSSHAASTPSFSSSSANGDSDSLSLQEKLNRDAHSFPHHPRIDTAGHAAAAPSPRSAAQQQQQQTAFSSPAVQPSPPFSFSSYSSSAITQLHAHLSTLVANPPSSLSLPSSPSLFDPASPALHSDILTLILQFLSDNNYSSAYSTLYDESAPRLLSQLAASPAVSSAVASRHRRLRRAILSGDYATADALAGKLSLPPYLQYLLHTQHYLELVERGEYQRAFSLLHRRLKPLERCAAGEREFADLCYLLVCKGVREAESFRDWPGLQEGRERLAERIEKISKWDTAGLGEQMLLAADGGAASASSASSSLPLPAPPPPAPPPHRLVTLLQQACAYQLIASPYRPRVTPAFTTFLSDFSPPSVPNAQLRVLTGHDEGVKAVGWVGDEGELLVSGGGEGDILLWRADTGEMVTRWRGHGGRIWEVDSSRQGECVVSGSADGSVRLWSVPGSGVAGGGGDVLSRHKGDVYTVSLHPSSHYCVSGGYDHQLVLHDLRTLSPMRSFPAHSAPVLSTAFTPHGNLLLSASLDHSLLFHDLLSSLPVASFSSPTAPITSVSPSPCATYLLLSCRDNSLRLLDIRTCRVVRRYRGCINTRRSWLRSCWGGAGGNFVMGGSEDGRVLVWEREGAELQQLSGHDGCVFGIRWNDRKQRLVTGGEDDAVRLWHFDPSRPVLTTEEDTD